MGMPSLKIIQVIAVFALNIKFYRTCMLHVGYIFFAFARMSVLHVGW